MNVTGVSINVGWYDLLEKLYTKAPGVITSSPRGMETREVLGAQLRILNPRACVLGFRERGLNYSFMAAEALWLSTGLNRVDLIAPYNKSLGQYAADEGASHFQGAYGPRVVDDIDYVVNTLRLDPDSRQALISIWRPRPRASADIPCTVSMQFLIRDGYLHMHTYMRSQDIWLGMPYDVFTFTFIQEIIAHRLNVQPGGYTHTMGSLHLYERNFDAAKEIVVAPWMSKESAVQIKRKPMTSAPVAQAMAAYIELTARGPGYMMEAARHCFVEEWWYRTYDALEGDQPWLDMLALCARRFHSGFGEFHKSEWDQLIPAER